MAQQPRPVALITGGAGALGSAIGAALIAEGWFARLADLDEEAACAAALRLGGPELADGVACDVRDFGTMSAVVGDLVARHGRLDGLMTAAGGGAALGPRKPFWETDLAAWTLNVETHLTGVLNACHAVLPPMVAQRQGVIVNIASGAGLPGGPPGSRQAHAEVYSAAKGGVIGFTQAIAQELAPLGIRANCVAPGRTESRRRSADHLNTLAEAEEAREPGSSRMSPLKRFSRAEDIGHAVAFLVSERAAFITGSCLDLTGGIRLH